MKRVGNLWEHVLTRENLLYAFHRAARGKRHKRAVIDFSKDLDAQLDTMRRQLNDRTFEIGRFTVFTIHDPKERTIHAPAFPEQVFHHALMRHCEPMLERQAIYHSYACRRQKGQLAAVTAAQAAARSRVWHLKLDIRRYFDSISHTILLDRIARVCKDPSILYWLDRIVRGYHAAPGRGLPIGSLTSQHLANFYLSGLDRDCHSLPGIKNYVRYMDDFVCWTDTKSPLKDAGVRIRDYVEQVLDLQLKHPPCPQRSARGMNFLGYRIFPSHMEPNRSSRVRYRRHLNLLARLYDRSKISDLEAQQRLSAATAFLLPTRSYRWRRRMMRTIRSVIIGFEPGEPWRQLEQQRDQHSLCEPQQQHPDEPQQQPGLSCGPQLRPVAMEDGVMRQVNTDVNRGLNRSSSRCPVNYSGHKINLSPSGTSSSIVIESKVPGGRVGTLFSVISLFPYLLFSTQHFISLLITS